MERAKSERHVNGPRFAGHAVDLAFSPTYLAFDSRWPVLLATMTLSYLDWGSRMEQMEIEPVLATAYAVLRADDCVLLSCG